MALQLPATHNQLYTTCYILYATSQILPFNHYPPATTHQPLPANHYPPTTTHQPIPADHYQPTTTRQPLLTKYCPQITSYNTLSPSSLPLLRIDHWPYLWIKHPVAYMSAYCQVRMQVCCFLNVIESILECTLGGILGSILSGVPWRILRAYLEVYSQTGWECAIGWNAEYTGDHVLEFTQKSLRGILGSILSVVLGSILNANFALYRQASWEYTIKYISCIFVDITESVLESILGSVHESILGSTC